MPFAQPAPLARGDLIAVVAPSSGVDKNRFDAGVAWLRGRYRIRMSNNVMEAQGYLAGADARRQAELASAMTDPEVKAIFCARGGYGAMRIVDGLPWDAFASSPKWIVGFSDITTFHVEATARRIASLHAPVVTQIGGMSDEARTNLGTWLEAPEKPVHFSNLQAMVPGSASGMLVGGNLSLLEAMAAGGCLSLPQGCILAMEDTNERPYRIDRMLTSLRLGGHLAKAAGIVLGEWTDCNADSDGVTVLDAIGSCVRGLGVPIYSGATFGHGAVNTPFMIGSDVTLGDGQLVSS